MYGPVCVQLRQFLSTLPVRGATMYVPNLGDIDLFLSTLPVRGATRPSWERHNGGKNHFYPRSP